MCKYGYSYCECKSVQTVCAIIQNPGNILRIEVEVTDWYAENCDRPYCTCSSHPDYNTRLNELLQLDYDNIVNNNPIGGDQPEADEENVVEENGE